MRQPAPENPERNRPRSTRNDKMRFKFCPSTNACILCNVLLHFKPMSCFFQHIRKNYNTYRVPGEISSDLYRDWLWDRNFKFCLIFTHFSRFISFSGYIWWKNTLSSLENFSLNSIQVFVFLMSHHDNGGFLKIAQKRDSISKKTSFCIMVINTDHQESWFLSVEHPLCALQ